MYFEDATYSYTASPCHHVLTLTLPVIPAKSQDWNIDVIDNLIQILSIESEIFDFKEPRSIEKNGELYKHICAMANTLGGYIVLGVGEDKSRDGTLIRFTKEGFRAGEEDKVNQSIANNVYEVEPTPSIEQVPLIYEKDSRTFYAIIKINIVDDLKPHFIKSRTQCYVRIGIVADAQAGQLYSIFSATIERRK